MTSEQVSLSAYYACEEAPGYQVLEPMRVLVSPSEPRVYMTVDQKSSTLNLKVRGGVRTIVHVCEKVRGERTVQGSGAQRDVGVLDAPLEPHYQKSTARSSGP